MDKDEYHAYLDYLRKLSAVLVRVETGGHDATANLHRAGEGLVANRVCRDLAEFVRCNLRLNRYVLFGGENICVAVFDSGGEIGYWVVRRDGKEIVATMPSAQGLTDNLENMQDIFELALSEGG